MCYVKVFKAPTDGCWLPISTCQQLSFGMARDQCVHDSFLSFFNILVDGLKYILMIAKLCFKYLCYS